MATVSPNAAVNTVRLASAAADGPATLDHVRA